MPDEVIDPENKTWKRGDDPAAAAIALAEASIGTTGSSPHVGEALTQLKAAQEEAKGEKAEPKKASHAKAKEEAGD